MLVSGSYGPISRVLGVRVPCLRVPESQGLGPQSPGSRVSGLRVPQSWVSGLGSQDHKVLRLRVLGLRP